MRRVLEDGSTTQCPWLADSKLFDSAEMIDLFLELSAVPEFPSVADRQEQPQADQDLSEPSRSNKDLIFIRRAIEVEPGLLESAAWGGMTMLDRAIKRDLQSLVSLYLEYSDGGQSNVDTSLHRAVAKGEVAIVKAALRYGANLGCQDEDECTALHLAAENYAREESDGSDTLLVHLLSEGASYVDRLDCEGRTALAIAAHGARARGNDLSRLSKAFLQAGADTKFLIRCRHCEKHEITLVISLALQDGVIGFGMVASDDRCNLNGRDSFGRTALSCCFAYQHGNDPFDSCVGYGHRNAAGAIGEHLLRQSAVEVNSRDDFGHTILEHSIRYPIPFDSISNFDRGFQSFVHEFFKSGRVDANLRTSDDRSPLELIVSLYDTWPAEFGHDPDFRSYMSEQECFNQHLVETLVYLLGTAKVDIDIQRRCAEHAVPELKRIILDSIQSMS